TCPRNRRAVASAGAGHAQSGQPRSGRSLVWGIRAAPGVNGVGCVAWCSVQGTGMTQEEFARIVLSFDRAEPMRAALYYRALALIEAGFQVEAHVLILATWNFAR